MSPNRPARPRLNLPAEVPTFPLSEFLEERWAYDTGEHTTILGPTGNGKTHLAQKLLKATATERRPAHQLVMKPRDKTVLDFAREERWKIHRQWPPARPAMPWEAKPVGHMIWPRHTGDPVRDDLSAYFTFRNSLLHAYKHGNRIMFVDEAAGMVELDTPTRNDRPLEYYMRQLWARGRSLGAGLWVASQRPVDIPLLAYGGAQHLFLGNDPDIRARKRYGEIGGIDPKLVEHVTSRLPVWYWFYVKRNGQRYCVITPD